MKKLCNNKKNQNNNTSEMNLYEISVKKNNLCKII